MPRRKNRANGLVGQVVRMLDRRGLCEAFAGESGESGEPQPMPAFFFGAVPVDLRTLEDNPLYLLPVPQIRMERVPCSSARAASRSVSMAHRSNSGTPSLGALKNSASSSRTPLRAEPHRDFQRFVEIGTCGEAG